MIRLYFRLLDLHIFEQNTICDKIHWNILIQIKISWYKYNILILFKVYTLHGLTYKLLPLISRYKAFQKNNLSAFKWQP